MEITLPLVFDQFRNVFGGVAAVLVFAGAMFPKKKNYMRKMLLLCIPLAIHALLYLWLRDRMVTDYNGNLWSGYAYLAVTALWKIFIVFLLYDAAFEQSMICIILGYTMELIPTAFLRYVLIDRLMPDLETRHFGIYVGILVMTYLAIYVAGRVFVADHLRGNGGNDDYQSQSIRLAILYLLIYAGIIVLISLLQMVLEKILPTLDVTDYREVYATVFYLCVSAIALTAVIVQALFVYIYRATILTSESRLLGQLLEDRGQQYAFLKENIDMINARCHEIKHQLDRLEVAGDAPHNEMLRKIRDSVNFYDANVKTGNEILDTILTEKSTLCAARGIKLIVIADVEKGVGMGVIDLYTMIGECLDNAISFTMQNPPDRKFISFRVQPVGDMLYFSIENYYQERPRYRNGLPLGADGKEHLRLVRRLARRIRGNVEVTQNEGNVLMVQVIVPQAAGK